MNRALLIALCASLLAWTGCAGDAEPQLPAGATHGSVFGLESEADEDNAAESSEASEESSHEPGSYESLDETYHHSEVSLVSQGNSTLLPFVEPMRRARQRMTIPQLSAALVHVSGGIGWTETQGGGEEDLFEVLASSLGVPDYVESTREDRSASPLFHKFLDESARHVCSELVARETSGQPYEPRLMVHADAQSTLSNNPEGVDDNLRYLLLRYHGRKYALGAPGLTAWRWLFESVTHVSQEPSVGWRAVCIALISHPDFYSY